MEKGSHAALPPTDEPIAERLLDSLEQVESGPGRTTLPPAEEPSNEPPLAAALPKPGDLEDGSYGEAGFNEEALLAAQATLAEDPTDPFLLLRASLAALIAEQPELSLRYQHRFSKRYPALFAEDQLLRAVALAQQGRWPQAAQILRHEGFDDLLFSAG